MRKWKELIDKKKMKEMQKEIKLLERRKVKMEKIYEKSCGKKYTKKDIEIIPVDGNEVDKSFIDTRKENDYVIPNYDVMVKDMGDIITSDRKLYSQYDIGNTSE